MNEGEVRSSWTDFDNQGEGLSSKNKFLSKIDELAHKDHEVDETNRMAEAIFALGVYY